MSVNKVELACLPFSNCNYEVFDVLYIERIPPSLILRSEGGAVIDSRMKSVLTFINATNSMFVWSRDTP